MSLQFLISNINTIFRNNELKGAFKMPKMCSPQASLGVLGLIFLALGMHVGHYPFPLVSNFQSLFVPVYGQLSELPHELLSC